LSATLDRYEPAALAAKRDEIRARLEEARLRLAELEAEIARREGGTEGPLELSALPREPAMPAEMAELDPGIASRMEEILAEITGGRYGRVRVEFGPAGFVSGVESREAGRFLEPANLSAGSLAQLRLAMHVAFTERLTGNVNPPFLLDDPFAELDEARLRSTLGFLARLSRSRQIVWFTRRGEMARMLEEAGITPGVIELEGP
ncbi:MAG: hypothetical protein K6U03_04265, partial [Firmicutes bacterium]|nr:hypothetical protein [Bacillota bacterium]